MNIGQIYNTQEFPTTQAQQHHMLMVEGLLAQIEPRWTGAKVNFAEIRLAALLHDLGNGVKFNLDDHPNLLGDEIVDLRKWRAIQLRMQADFGQSDIRATDTALQRLGFNDRIREIIRGKDAPGGITPPYKLEKMLLHFADLHVRGSHFVSPDERFADIAMRHGNNGNFDALKIQGEAVIAEVTKDISGNTTPFSERLVLTRKELTLASLIPRRYFTDELPKEINQELNSNGRKRERI